MAKPCGTLMQHQLRAGLQANALGLQRRFWICLHRVLKPSSAQVLTTICPVSLPMSLCMKIFFVR